jgi:hypothetical protein
MLEPTFTLVSRSVPDMKRQRPEVDAFAHSLPELRFEIFEAARILRMSRAQLYNRIQQGSISPQKDGARTYVTRAELERYVNACESHAFVVSTDQSTTDRANTLR